MFDRIVSETILALLFVSLLLPLAQAEDDLITAPLDELLPSREDIPSEWEMGGFSNVTLEEPGFVEGKTVWYFKDFGGSSAMDLDFYVYRFSDGNSAKTYHDKEVDEIESEGGYTEVIILDAFAVVYDWGVGEQAVSWGVESNVAFKVEIWNNYEPEDPTDELIAFTDLEKTIVPEFPLLLIPPLFMITTLLVAVLRGRKRAV